MPLAGEVALRIRAKVLGIPVDEATVAHGEKALPDPLRVVEGQLAKNKWMLGGEFSLVDCGYCPILNVIEKAGFSFGEFPNSRGCSRGAPTAGGALPATLLSSPAAAMQRGAQ